MEGSKKGTIIIHSFLEYGKTREATYARAADIRGIIE